MHDAWRAIRTADRIVGPGPSFVQYARDGHAGIPEVCLALLEPDGDGGNAPGAGGPEPAELHATAAAGLRRLRHYARSFPMAQPRALTCLGWSRWLDGQHRPALRAWARAVREAERLRMPYELARAHFELGRHLDAGQRSPSASTAPGTWSGRWQGSRPPAAAPTCGASRRSPS